ncbi:Sir2 family NAD-dependent protein deacetylase [Lichenihabitans sp. Uapishka_5]|uniref:SIR2 family NAD-dependent protein deacylase n=1 Tax=Lichenihabitans sp. Uapishka_5 TaxID=3037302 RepID=UPI0029E800D2|nr:Sir2 family NAD-dependent protein deacetylase [Lichenihabitans sp. Uapishka_5]MDX7952523.1 Sir2 family NAD-dependent protein deacetylase [Lichenihabitans sp. Uapishka_5]
MVFDHLAELARSARRITVLTGAGVSTESGVPDFRSPGSPWLVHKPIGYAEFLSGAEVRAEAWRRKFAMDDIYRDARPNRAHAALARLDGLGRLVAVVTQNIDGLHAAAGLAPSRLVELHGNGTYAHCLTCGQHFELATVRRHLEATGCALDCACGGFIKSATVAFGQTLPTATLQRAVAAAKGCDLFVAVGSSLVVRPAATLPQIAQAHGAVLVILNREATPLDPAADHLFRCDAGDGLLALLDGVAATAG